MKQVTQRLKDGAIEVLEVPPPSLTAEGVIVDVRASLLSAGTERSKIEAGRKSLLGKARARPDQVRAVVEKARRDGVKATAGAVRARLDEPSALGYSAAGLVTRVGARVRDLAVGDRVACAGGGYAVHAELVHVPGNLCVRLPDSVSFTEGAFATIGSIGLHAVRQADVRLGERVAVVGLGLVGQLAAQLLKAAGCRVVGIDLSSELVGLAQRIGAIDYGIARAELARDRLPEQARDCDAVLITAATQSDDPVQLAADLCRDRGRVVVVGDVGLKLPRAPYYEKEIELRLSRSYGPGRYDRAYEERGLDYPIGYVRWTERRNMEAFVDLIATEKVAVEGLITDRMSIDEAPAAYERLTGAGSPLGIVLEYESTPASAPAAAEVRVVPSAVAEPSGSPTVAGLIGAGSFAQRILIPALADTGFELASVASGAGLSARSAAERFPFGSAATAGEIIDDPRIGLIVIATRHSSHAALASTALRAGKAVFVEKPPCLTSSELRDLRAASWESGRPLAVGFNRRHAPLAQTLRDHVAEQGPINLIYRVKPDPLPADHWLLDPDEGGPLLGEGCHFIDLACFMVGALPDRVSCTMPADLHAPMSAAQRFTATLEFGDGSLATINYGSAGASAVGKEHLEIHSGDRSGLLDDFRRLTLYSGRRREVKRARGQDKGHVAQIAHLRSVLEGKKEPGDGLELDPLDTMQVTLAALVSAQAGRSVSPAEAAGDEANQ